MSETHQYRVHLIGVEIPRNTIMPDPEAIRRLLTGEINPPEIEDDPGLYSMAERIYGAEALEEMGVSAPTISSPRLSSENLPITPDVTLPDFVPVLPDSKSSGRSSKERPRLLFVIPGILGLMFAGLNMTVGVGQVLCSLGLADMREICNEDYGQTKLDITKGYTWDGLHQIESWVKPMEGVLVGDVALIVAFVALAFLGFMFRKKSVHPSDILPVES